MSTNAAVEPLADRPASLVLGRIAAAAFLILVLTVVGCVGIVVFDLVTDSWVAPLHLSPSNDQVLQLSLRAARQEAEMSRLVAEVDRIDEELQAIDAALERVETALAGVVGSRVWEANDKSDEATTLAAALVDLGEEQGLLESLRTRQESLVEKSAADLADGLIDRTAHERQLQSLDTIRLQQRENLRMTRDGQLRLKQLRARASAWQAVAPGTATSALLGQALLPELAASEEHVARLELEALRLGAERRSLVRFRAVAAESLAREQAVMEELRTRPQYRAISESLDVAFIPYRQLEGVLPGGRVMACVGGVVLCREVGVVTEILPGEVVTQGPWGEQDRGRYAVLELTNPDAVRERVLRVRGS